MFKSIVGLIFLWFSQHVFAYTSLTVFGDSLFDGGNSDTAVISHYKLFGVGYTAPPYSDYRYTNGPAIAEYLATELDLNNASQFFNYAVGGATTTDIKQYTQSYISTADDTGLYLINGGANDIALGYSANVAVQNILDTVINLNNKGAKNFFIMNLPVGGATASVFSDFNTKLGASLAGLSLTNSASSKLFDLGSESPAGAGFTNYSEPCFDGLNLCSNPDEYVFWDSRGHFTTKLYSLIGQRMAETITPVPEPESHAMFFAGLGLIGFIAFWKKSRFL